MKIISVVVARRDSTRVTGKALVNVGGETLIERKINQLKKVPSIEQVIVGTNWTEVAKVAELLDATVIYRDDYHCDESVCSANEMIGDMIARLDCDDEDIVVWAHPTNPLISPSTYELSIKNFLNSEKNGFDSLLSVKVLQEHIWDQNKKPLNYNPYDEFHTLAKDLPKYYMQDGGIFIQRYRSFKENSYFFGSKPYLFPIPNFEYCDINYEADIVFANYMIDNFNGK
ncbi:acylneuraminate cytidylyltransferase family protein [Vibrio sinaloensis]|uniref:acylneuraminate cytidylyltransferase family protein n=1 Tax=Photobacterium sp. (strain ATCC 43367) TaxID=379097 RepID=UPI0035E9CA14